MSYRFADSLRAGLGRNVLILLASCQQTCMIYTIAVFTVKNSYVGQRNCPKHVDFYSKNKFEKLVHLVGFNVLILLASCQQTCMTYTIAVCTVKNSYDGQRNCPKHVEFYSKNKFEKLVDLVGFILTTA